MEVVRAWSNAQGDSFIKHNDFIIGILNAQKVMIEEHIELMFVQFNEGKFETSECVTTEDVEKMLKLKGKEVTFDEFSDIFDGEKASRI